MTDQKTRADRFRALHVPGAPLVLHNIWDAGSARALASANPNALATSSWAVAAAHGVDDGEKLPLDMVIANLQRIVAVTDLPVSIDIESGYDRPAETVERTIEAGAIGCNMEDSDPRDGLLREALEQAHRIGEARRAADASGMSYFINARTDVFFQQQASSIRDGLQAAIDRAHIYADAGADGIFIPGLVDIDAIAKLVEESPLPVNVMLDAHSARPEVFAQAGVSRVSYGPALYLRAMDAMRNASRSL